VLGKTAERHTSAEFVAFPPGHMDSSVLNGEVTLHGVVLRTGYNLAEIIHAGGMFLGFGPGVLRFFRTCGDMPSSLHDTLVWDGDDVRTSTHRSVETPPAFDSLVGRSGLHCSSRHQYSPVNIPFKQNLKVPAVTPL